MSTKPVAKEHLNSELVRFVTVGAISFTVNFIVLWLAHGKLGVNLLVSQLLAGEVALLASFAIHHNWTYSGYLDTPLIRRLGQFHATAWTGVILNAVMLWGIVRLLGIHYLVAICISASVVMVWNYLLNKYHVWAKAPDKGRGEYRSAQNLGAR